jgi:hypothetical protein
MVVNVWLGDYETFLNIGQANVNNTNESIHMKRYRLFDIEWDVEGKDYDDDASLPDLPNEVNVSVEDDFDPVEDSADLLSDEHGFCINGCKFEQLNR